MAKGIATIHVKQRKGHPTIQAMGKTPRDQAYIKELVSLPCKKMSDESFKKEMAEAIAILLA